MILLSPSRWYGDCNSKAVLGPIADRLEQYMDLLAARQKLVAANIANIDTPGYSSKDIDFQSEFNSLMKGDSPHVIETPDLLTKNDGNNVNLDRETRLLAENDMRFSVAESLLRSQVLMLRTAIKEGSS